MKEYLLGIDLGTSGTKTVLFRSDGTAMAAHTVEYPLYQPQNGWAEQEPSDWWRAVRETVQAVLHKSGVAAADVAGVGISGQMHGLVMLDERGEVLHRSILWCDGRTGEESEKGLGCRRHVRSGISRRCAPCAAVQSVSAIPRRDRRSPRAARCPSAPAHRRAIRT